LKSSSGIKPGFTVKLLLFNESAGCFEEKMVHRNREKNAANYHGFAGLGKEKSLR